MDVIYKAQVSAEKGSDFTNAAALISPKIVHLAPCMRVITTCWQNWVKQALKVFEFKVFSENQSYVSVKE